LPAAVVPVLVGTACAYDGGKLPDWGRFVLAATVALALQVGTNYANDYSDGRRGTDDPANRVGPPRLVGNGLAEPAQVKAAALLAFATAGVAGLVLTALVGWQLIPVGAAAILAGWFYTGGPRPYGYAGLGEAFVFVFFGLVATAGSAYVQTGRLTWLSAAFGVVVGFLATAILVVNNLRDIPGDTAAGKRTLAVRLGDRRTRLFYVGLMVAPFVLTPVIAGLSGRPVVSLCLAAIMVATPNVVAVLNGATGRALIPVLGGTGRTQLVFGVLAAIGLVVIP
jgi:1,4-dihydroxy-2-naphthoate octaprenyltransferase